MTETPRRVDQPAPGFFLLRLVRGGPHVPAAIMFDGLQWQAVINGEPREAHADPAFAPDVFRIWHGGRTCTETEYRYRLQLQAWAAKHAPAHPAARPRDRIDLPNLPPVI